MSTSVSSTLSRALNLTTDIVIVGGGISGTLAAAVLGRHGYNVCLIDRYSVYPPDFRAEHLDGPQVQQLRRLGFLDHLTMGLYRGETVKIARFGRVLGVTGTVNYGLRYEDLVNRARATLPSAVRAITGRVARVETGDTTQRITLADGRIINARLLVVATGQGYAVSKQIGLTRQVIREGHSLTFGFNIEAVDKPCFDDSFVVYQREKIQDRIDYLAAFTMGGATRVNLFTYRDYREPWTDAFLANPDAVLARTLPGLAAVLGKYRTVGPVVVRPIDLYRSENYRRDGVVLIGDAFQSACPATGMGMVRLLTDIERLTQVYVPQWLQTPGMSAAKTTMFYDDPVKRACDKRALHDSEYRRAISTETSPRWHLHRARVLAVEHLRGWRSRRLTMVHPRVDTDPSEASLVPG